MDQRFEAQPACAAARNYPDWVLTQPPGRVAALVALTYGAAVAFSQLLAQFSLGTSTIWLPSGIGLIAVLIWGYWLLPLIAVVHIGVSASLGELSLLARLGTGMTATAEMALSAWLLGRRDTPRALTFDLPGMTRFALICLLLVPMGGALIAATWLWTIGVIPASHTFGIARNWWLAVAFGMLCITPLANNWLVHGPPRFRSGPREALPILSALLLPTGLILVYQFEQHSPVEAVIYASLPMLLWAGMFLRETGAAAMLALLTSLVLGVNALIAGSAVPVWSAGAQLMAFGLMSLLIASAQSGFEQRIAERAAQHISARRERAQAIEERELALAASRAKDDFLATVTHELRTPLATVLGAADLLADAALPDDARRLLSTQRQAGQHLLDLINDILDFARIQDNRLELQERAFSPAALLDEVETMFQPQAQAAGLALQVESDGAPAALRGDPQRLRQILTNLVANAIRHTHSGGVIIRAEALNVTAERPGLAIEVEDTGEGIAPDERERLFERFFQGRHGSTGSVGLGLAIVQRLVQTMGGTVAVDSELGLGSRFRIELPLAQARPESTPAPGAAPSHRTRRLLLVEDLPENRDIVARLLEREGHSVTACADGAQALAAIGAPTGAEFEVVLLDLNLPDMDGFELAAAIRARLKPRGVVPKLVALTASATHETSRRCAAASIDVLLTKPLDLRQLARALAGGNVVAPLAARASALDPLNTLTPEERAEFYVRHGQTRREVAECLAQALAGNDASAAAAAAHRLAGSAAFSGNQVLADLARSASVAAEQGQLGAAKQLAAALADAHL